ncbi:MAG: cation-translocating P-type ATPase [Oscillospiraceae bacterium]|nr:cation-translocating P-type ATPase [Oscillospiraceae bacterium]
MNPQDGAIDEKQAPLRHDANTDTDTGLSEEEPKPQRKTHGRQKPFVRRVINRFVDIPVLILAALSIVSGLTQSDIRNTIVIISILAIKILLGIIFEKKAKNAIKETGKLSAQKVTEKRNGQAPESELTVASIGATAIAPREVTADAAIEAAGNAHVEMTADAYEKAEQKGSLTVMARTLYILSIAVCALIFVIGILYNLANIGQQRPILELLLLVFSLAVAAIPSGMTKASAMISAIGVKKMAKENILVRKLGSVEAIGKATVICANKTGTFSENIMTVVKVADSVNVYDVTGVGYRAKGHVVSDIMLTRNVSLMTEISVLCNNASYDEKKSMISGEPTEGAMLVLGAKLGHDKDGLNSVRRRILEIPFDPVRKMMSTCNADGSRVIMNTKGAPEEIISRSSYVYLDGEVVHISEPVRIKLMQRSEELASEGLRVLAFAYKVYNDVSQLDNAEEDLVFVGMMGIADPLRKAMRGSVKDCQMAGINIKMITGEHKSAAAAAAYKLGIIISRDEVLDGREIDMLTDDALRDKVKTVNVFARAAPEQKARIIRAIKENNDIVALIGDDMRDAAAMEKADIAIAMGKAVGDFNEGIEKAADMILIDDNFADAVKAVEYGRMMYGNIKRAAGYILSCNIGRIMFILLSVIFALPLPLIAVQLLLISLVTEFFPVFALCAQSKDAQIMMRKPRNPNEVPINRKTIGSALIRGAMICAGTIGAFLYGLYIAARPDGVTEQTVAMSMCFLTLAAGELFTAYSAKREKNMRESGFIYKNKPLGITVLISLILLLTIIYLPFLGEFFSVIPLSIDQILVCALFAAIAIGGYSAFAMGRSR